MQVRDTKSACNPGLPHRRCSSEQWQEHSKGSACCGGSTAQRSKSTFPSRRTAPHLQEKCFCSGGLDAVPPRRLPTRLACVGQASGFLAVGKSMMPGRARYFFGVIALITVKCSTCPMISGCTAGTGGDVLVVSCIGCVNSMIHLQDQYD